MDNAPSLAALSLIPAYSRKVYIMEILINVNGKYYYILSNIAPIIY